MAQARTAVDDAAAKVADIELTLALQQSELDTAWQAVGVAGEAYTQAVVDADAATKASEAAAARSRQAEQAAKAARQEPGHHRARGVPLRRRDGPDRRLAQLLRLRGPGRPDGGHRPARGCRRRASQRLEAAELVASTLRDHAAQTATAARRADHAQQALQRAQAAQAAAERKVTQVQSERETLIAQLAHARQVSVDVERARQAQLDAERRARQDAAARRERETAQPAAPTQPPATQPPATQPPATQPPATQPPATQPPRDSAAAADAAAGDSAPRDAAARDPAARDPAAGDAAPCDPAAPHAYPPPTQPAPDPYGLGTGTQRGNAAQGQAAVAWALARVGAPYSYGAAGPDSFDCSGLTMRAWQAAGVALYRTSRDQYRQVLKISYGALRPGDLVFWGTDPHNAGSVYHVAMYIGNGQIVEAPRPGLTVRVTSMRWSNTMPYAGRA